MALQKPKREGRKKYYCGMMALTFIKGMDLAILHTTYRVLPSVVDFEIQKLINR